MITTISIQFSLTIVIITGLFFVALGYLNSKKTISTQDYIVGNRDENTFTLTASLTASALGAWILFGPASAATWGGLGAVIGYACGQSFVFLYFTKVGVKIRKLFPNARSLTEVISKRYSVKVCKLKV